MIKLATMTSIFHRQLGPYLGVKQAIYAALLAILASSHSGSAQSILLSDNFSGTAGAAIGGNALAVNNINSATWVSSGSATYTGSSSGSFGTAGVNALLTEDTGSYVFNNAGVYSLNLTINSGGTSGGAGTDWYAFGWSALPASGTSYTMASSGTFNVGYAWLLLRGNGQLNVYAGPGTSGTALLSTATSTYNAGTYNLSLVLDTTGANYMLNAYIDSVQLDLNGASAGNTYTYSSNPTAAQLQYVGISSAATTPAVSDTFSNFSLTTPASVPEPSTLALGLIGGGLLLVWRRKFAR
jgi:hypothetical protein